MIKRIMPSTIRGKVMLFTGAITFLIAAVTVSICFVVFQSFLRRNQIQSAEYNLQVVSHNVSNDMESIVYFSDWCCSSIDIVRYLEGFEKQVKMPSISSNQAPLRSMALDAYNRLKNEYFNTAGQRYINQVLVSPENCLNYLMHTDKAAASFPRAASIIRDLPYFEELISAGQYTWPGLKEPPWGASDSSLCIPMARPVHNQYNSGTVGWTFLTVSDHLFLDYLKNFPLEQDNLLYITIGGHSYRYEGGHFTETTPDCTVIKDISRKDVHSADTSATLIRLEDGSLRRMVTCPLWDQGWTISLILSERDYNAQNQMYLLIIGTIVIVISLMGLMLAYILNRAISRPVMKLREKIHLISEGDFAREPAIEWPDELGAIGRGINQMSENVAGLMDKRVEDEKQKKDLEYRILQSQINPHFLYNTLNSIKWMATIQNAPGIAEMTTALARLMKNVSKGTDTRISLKEELDLVKDYFLIQQYRYGGSISIEYDIRGQELPNCQIHRFTLQPLVENALFHGIEPKGCAGKVLIRAEKKELSGKGLPAQELPGKEPPAQELSGKELPAQVPCLVISVTDNGIGMSPETIKKVLSGDAVPSADFFKQVGINNVDKRIKYDFGPEYGIGIESVVGEYTTMIITLPYILTERI